jgi:predicted nucleic acid-binding protein
MNVLFDLNVLLDVIQRREPHFGASAAVCALAVRKEVSAYIPAHAVTTVGYIVRKYAGAKKESDVLDWLLAGFTVAPSGHLYMLRAKSLKMADFEDAVVVATAGSCRCSAIVTRNVSGFKGAPVPALTPEEFLAGGEAKRAGRRRGE